MAAESKVRMDAYDLPFLVGTWVETPGSIKSREDWYKVPCWSCAVRFIGEKIAVFYMTVFDPENPETPRRYIEEFIYFIDGSLMFLWPAIGSLAIHDEIDREEAIEATWALFGNGVLSTINPLGRFYLEPATREEIIELGFSAAQLDRWVPLVQAVGQEVIDAAAEDKIQELIARKLWEEEENLR